MKAIRVHQFGGPEVMRLEECPTPVPTPGQVLIRLRAIGVNPVETYWRAGANPNVRPPYTPGTDAAGVVEDAGEGVGHVRRGDRVYTSGTLTGAYAEFALCLPGTVHPLPDHISFVQGAAINIPCATAWRALFQRGGATAGETVLIHGASGGVGVAAVQMARAAGLTVIATAGTARGRDLVMEQGAHHVLDHTQAGHLDALPSLTGGRGADLILEMLANANLGLDLPALAPRGRVIIIGSRGKVEITPRDLMSREADVRGLMLFAATPPELDTIHAALRRGLDDLTLRPVVGREFPLASADRAHVEVMAAGACGKIVLLP